MHTKTESEYFNILSQIRNMLDDGTSEKDIKMCFIMDGVTYADIDMASRYSYLELVDLSNGATTLKAIQKAREEKHVKDIWDML